jgi:hypothetical protein
MGSISMLRRPCDTRTSDFKEAACAAVTNGPNGDSAHAAMQHVVIMVTVSGHTPG